MPGAIDNVPYEIWQHISSYLSSSQLRRMISVNRALYNIALDHLYETIEWCQLDGDMVKSLICLRDQKIAARVRKIRIRTWLVSFLYSEASQTATVARFWGLPLLHYIRKPRPSLKGRSDTWIEVEKWRLKLQYGPTKDTLDAMRSAVANLVNLRECTLDMQWYSPAARLFLCTLWKTIQNGRLQKFVLTAPVEGLEVLTPARLDDLRELDVTLIYTSLDSIKRDMDRDLLVARVVPFIDALSSTVSSLRLTTSPQLDHSAFFHALGRFPYLQELSLHVGFDHESLSQPSGLLRFLWYHSAQLKSFELVPEYSEEDVFEAFSTQLTKQPKILSGLKSLTISRTSDFDIILSLVERSKDTLSNLTIQDHFLELYQIRDLTMALSHRITGDSLTSLHIEVRVLCPAILDLLSRYIPALESLDIVFKKISGTYLNSDGDEVTASTTSTEEAIFNPSAWSYPAFTDAMMPGRYENWALRNVGIWENGVHDHAFVDEKQIMFSIAGAVPRILTFRGKPTRTFGIYGMTTH